MKITSQEEYGLRCLMQLARASDRHSVSIHDVAEAEGLSSAYVAKLLAVLRQAGLVDSVHGRSGGYRLAAPPGEVKLGSVLMALGEPLFDEPTYCQKHAGTETDGCCVHLSGCNLRVLWQTLEQWMRRTLDRITLADLLQTEDQIFDLLRTRLAEAVQEPVPGAVSLTMVSE